MKIFNLVIMSFFFVFATAIGQNNVELSELAKNNSGKYVYNGELYTGTVYAKHVNGTIGLIGEVKEGSKEGIWQYFYSTGEKKRESTYINNKKEGITYYWYQNGQVAKEIMYRSDKNIDQKLWDENGKRKPNPGFDSFR
ncbi:MAG: hypothetical protein PF481_02165 [Bacteroidales bacterium]|jgi:antitoxin component YwqK of YwqJK toxin-antitoxin module|nr:hypothetical protein [Bacteroidales bacterium]